MKLCLILMILSVMLTHIGCVRLRYPPEGCSNCYCKCEEGQLWEEFCVTEPPTTTTTTTTTTTPTTTTTTPSCVSSTCDNFRDPDSTFSKKCAPRLHPGAAGLMYEHCLHNEDTGDMALFLKNVKSVCKTKRVKITLPPGRCPNITVGEGTTPVCEPLSVCDNLAVWWSEFSVYCAPLLGDAMTRLMYKVCLGCEQLGQEELDVLVANITQLCLAKGSVISIAPITCVTTSVTTTSCISSKCDNFLDPNSQFTKKCASLLHPGAPEMIYHHCLHYESLGVRLFRKFLKSAKLACHARGANIRLPQGSCPDIAVGETTTTECVPVSVCDQLEQWWSEFSLYCAASFAPGELISLQTACMEGENQGPCGEAGFAHHVTEICSNLGATITLAAETCGQSGSCPCIDVMFMVDGSESISDDDFQHELEFTKKVLNQLEVCDDCTRIGLMSWDSDTQVEVPLGSNNNLNDLIDNVVDALPFLRGVTNLHLAIDEYLEQVLTHGRADCQPVGVLLTDGQSTNWRATLLAMINLYKQLPNAKMVVIADIQDNPPIEEVKALATGDDESNLVMVHGFSELDDALATQTAQLIHEPYTPQDCSQLAVVGTLGTSLGDMFLGDYEEAGDLAPCNGKPFYRRVGSTSLLLSKQAINVPSYGMSVPPNWMLGDVAYDDCSLDEGSDDLEPFGFYTWSQSGAEYAPDSSSWLEFDEDADTMVDSGISVHCYQ